MTMKKFPPLGEKFPNLLNRKEAEAKGIKIREDWRNAEIGESICTIDDVVLEIKDIYEYRQGRDRKATIYFITEIGKFPTTIHCVYARRVPFNKDTDLMTGSHLQKVFIEDVKIYGELGENGNYTPASVISCYKSVFAENNDALALFRGRNILKKVWAREYMATQLKQAFIDKKYDNEKIAEQYIKFIENEKIPAAVRKQCLDVVKESVNTPDKGEGGGKLKLLLSEQDMAQLKPISALIALFKSFQAENKIIDGEFVDLQEWNKRATEVLLIKSK